MEQICKAVFQRASLHADFYWSRDAGHRSDWVFVTFTERFNRDLRGPGFGTEFLLREGFDVLAIKNSIDDWYVQMGADELAALGRMLSRYRNRASYGSSMGGFAAIKFARALGIQRALAISPIQDIRYDWDIRHVENIPALGDFAQVAPGDMISRAEISEQTTYYIAFDPYCREDARHANILHEMTFRRALLEVPWGGHPVGPAMSAAGILGAFVREAIKSNDLSQLRVRTPRTGSTLRNRARYLLDHDRLRSALVVSTHAVKLSPDWDETCILHAQILHRLGRLEEAVQYGMRAVELERGNPYIAAIVARILIDQGASQKAGKLVTTAIGKYGKNESLESILKEIRM